MRILAALTLLISVSISSSSLADPVELQWSFVVDTNLFSSDPEAGLLAVGSINNLPNGGCAARITIRDNLGERRVYFALDQNGALIWQRLEKEDEQFGWVRMISRENLVFEIGAGDLLSVCLKSGSEQIIRRSGANAWRVMSAGYKWPAESLLVTNGRASAPAGVAPETGVVVIRRLGPRNPTPDLAPSTFGLEDGNLIISWPAAAGHTYQVQRSTDLESWENIGVALTGNGTTMSYSQPSNADKVFLRVVIP